MITGHNTDVQHNEIVFHVQTEDKGVSNPFIESLVYVKGQILGARRVAYADLLTDGKGEKEIINLMDQQHRQIIAAIKAGKFDAKLEALTGGQVPKVPSGTVSVVPDAPGSSQVQPPDDDLAIDSSRTLDQVILDYLTSEADQEQLLLMVDGDDNLSAGQQAGLAVQTRSSKSGVAISNATVEVRMISTNMEPRTLATGETDAEGALHLEFKIPVYQDGAAALIIVADSTIGAAEIKHLL
jgi:hypothetical protein